MTDWRRPQMPCDYVPHKVIVKEMRCIEHGEIVTKLLTQDEIAELRSIASPEWIQRASLDTPEPEV